MKKAHRIVAEDIFSKISMALTEIGRTMPVYIMILPDETIIPIVVTNKEITMEEYSSLSMRVANENNALALIIVCEQYMVAKEKGDIELDALLDGRIRASEHPDRGEYLTLVYMDREGKCESMISKIHRDPIGTPFTRDFKWIDDSITTMITPWI